MLPRSAPLFLPFLFAIAPGHELGAQIFIEAADMPVIGDVVVRYRDTIPVYGPGGSGPMQAWDFSTALLHDTLTTTVLAPAGTPNGGSFTASNLAMTNGDGSYLYFNLTPAAMFSTGAAGDLLGDGQNIVTVFSPALTLHDFPRTYGDHSSGDFYFEATAGGSAFGVHSVRLRHYGTVFDSTDAYGQLTTPVGTYDVLRAKSTSYNLDSLWFRLLSFAPWTFFDVIQDTSVSYSWLAKETKLAVAELTFDSLGNPNRFIYSSIAPDISTGIAMNDADAVSIAPQPAVDGFTLDLAAPARYRTAEVIAADGRVVRTIALVGMGRQWVPTADWPSGIHLLRLVPAGGGPPVVTRVAVE